MRDQQAMQSSLEVGDEVMTTSGIYGFITGFEDDRIWLEIDDDVQIRVNRGVRPGQGRHDPRRSRGRDQGHRDPGRQRRRRLRRRQAARDNQTRNNTE